MNASAENIPLCGRFRTCVTLAVIESSPEVHCIRPQDTTGTDYMSNMSGEIQINITLSMPYSIAVRRLAQSPSGFWTKTYSTLAGGAISTIRMMNSMHHSSVKLPKPGKYF